MFCRSFQVGTEVTACQGFGHHLTGEFPENTDSLPGCLLVFVMPENHVREFVQNHLLAVQLSPGRRVVDNVRMFTRNPETANSLSGEVFTLNNLDGASAKFFDVTDEGFQSYMSGQLKAAKRSSGRFSHVFLHGFLSNPNIQGPTVKV